MPSHWGHKALNIVSQGSPTGTQCLQAVGCAEAGMLYERVAGHSPIARRSSTTTRSSTCRSATARRAKASSGSRSTRPARATLPVLFLVEDNGYAISVPVEVQTAGGDISKLVESFPDLKVVRCDGTDFLESYRAVGEAVAYVRRERKPALVHAKVIRPYSHSLSDDERLYKTAEEREAEARRDPLARMRAFLAGEGLATDADLEAIAADVDREVNEATDAALAAPKPPAETAGWYVFSPDVDPDVGRVRDARAARRASPTRWSRRSTAR